MPDKVVGVTLGSLREGQVVTTKSVLANTIVASISLICALGFGEIIVRWLYRDETVLFPRYHTDYQYGRYTIRGNRPNAEFWHTSVDGSWRFSTNSKGFRNATEFAYAKPANTMRILSIGDSHTQGHEVRQDSTFSAVLERYLNHNKIRAEVINAGVSGFGTAEELVFLENEGFKYQPDVVVLGFFANDFEDNLKAGLFDLDGRGHLVELKRQHIPGVQIQNFIYEVPAVKWLSENSYFYSLLFNGMWNYFKAKLTVRAMQQAAATAGPLPAAPDHFEFAVPTMRTPSNRQVLLAAALIDRMRRFCNERAIRLIIIDIPTRLGPHRYGSSLLPALRAKIKEPNVEYVISSSLLQDFEGAVETHQPHGYYHISEFTHALIGTAIGRKIINGM